MERACLVILFLLECLQRYRVTHSSLTTWERSSKVRGWQSISVAKYLSCDVFIRLSATNVLFIHPLDSSARCLFFSSKAYFFKTSTIPILKQLKELLQHSNQHRMRRFCDNRYIAKHVRLMAANSSRSQTVMKLNLVEVLEFNLLRSIPCERLHQH